MFLRYRLVERSGDLFVWGTCGGVHGCPDDFFRYTPAAFWMPSTTGADVASMVIKASRAAKGGGGSQAGGLRHVAIL